MTVVVTAVSPTEVTPVVGATEASVGTTVVSTVSASAVVLMVVEGAKVSCIIGAVVDVEAGDAVGIKVG